MEIRRTGETALVIIDDGERTEYAFGEMPQHIKDQLMLFGMRAILIENKEHCQPVSIPELVELWDKGIPFGM